MSFYINLNYPSSKSRCCDVSLLTRIGRPCWDNIISQLVRQWKGLDKIPSQNTNQNTVSDTPTLIKRSCAVVLINKRISNCVHETKAVEETKVDEINITENRARWKKTKTKKKKKPRKISPGKHWSEIHYIINFWRRNRVKEENAMNP